MTILINTYDLKQVEMIVIQECINAYPKLDLGEIAKKLNIGRTTLYQKLRNWKPTVKLNYKKFSDRRVGRESECPHTQKQAEKRLEAQKEREFKKKNKEYIKQKAMSRHTAEGCASYNQRLLTRRINSINL